MTEQKTERIGFMVQCLLMGGWTDYDWYYDRSEAGKVADFLTRQGNDTRIIVHAEPKQE